jgi:hypothetical protein
MSRPKMILFISFVLVALIGGLGPGQGNVYALNYETETFGPVCDDAWNMQGVRFFFRFSYDLYRIIYPFKSHLSDKSNKYPWVWYLSY